MRAGGCKACSRRRDTGAALCRGELCQLALGRAVEGRALIEGVCAQARAAGIKRVYWQTHETNSTGRRLYDQVAKHHGFIVYARDVV